MKNIIMLCLLVFGSGRALADIHIQIVSVFPTVKSIAVLETHGGGGTYPVYYANVPAAAVGSHDPAYAGESGVVNIDLPYAKLSAGTHRYITFAAGNNGSYTTFTYGPGLLTDPDDESFHLLFIAPYFGDSYSGIYSTYLTSDAPFSRTVPASPAPSALLWLVLVGAFFMGYIFISPIRK